MKGQKLIIGITGGIACGKSEICRILEAEGFLHIDADAVCHEILRKPEIVRAVQQAFGDDVVHNGEILRSELGMKVFGDPEKLALLESIEVPAILEDIYRTVEASDRSIVIEAIKLISSGLCEICDFVWFVDVDEEAQLARLMHNRGMTEEQARLRLDAQRSDNDWDPDKIDFVIKTDIPLDQMPTRVNDLLEECRSRKSQQQNGR